mmetsp:Transcript_196/g.379  ORF Transcript_196/g.379 Transcript_196/m.379 type:complete len:122 (+) Transcript_196:108-473(+)|eukprot:CAMPEP_0195522332 /NCGR_PEP_ID=MMETSP0794_2-20130614/20397_1 /TAXON_ID=515487 /ORGANISM="Stephanopyxis turris, Strain CCMP 815" /LENGTH=121 /DNA_ID=CAMNT_0040652061 /DNA_START=108 /DNA_END=473 /DNA_ORIENTATION=-
MDDEPEFVSEEVIQVIKSCIESTLSNTVYDKKKLNGWCNRVVEGCIKGVLKMDKPFKYVVTCILMQKNGAGLTTTATCYWDQQTDGVCTIPWENDTMHAVITVYACALGPREMKASDLEHR